MSLVTAIGGTTSDSYATLAEAEAYMATLIFKDAWTAASEATKEAALKQASRLMNSLGWKGQRLDQCQALAWPRCQGYNRRGQAEDYLYDLDGWPVSWDEIPACVKNAQVEFAFRLLSEDRTADAGALVPDSLTVGSLTVGKMRHQVFPAPVLSMVAQFLNSRPGCIQTVRG